MKIFIDSADLGEIKQAREWGMMDGVTTNPSLMKAAVNRRVSTGEPLDLKKYIQAILETAAGTPVSLEVTTLKADDMIREGKKLYNLFNPVAGNVVIKIPVNPSFTSEGDTHFDGLKAIKALADEGIPVNTTLIFTPEQALLAAKAGAAMVSPFAGRIDDFLRTGAGLAFNKTDYYPGAGFPVDGQLLEDNGIVSGSDLVEQCVDILSIYEMETEVLAASLRNPRQVREAALAGAQIATLPFGVLTEMLKHPKTFEGMKKFTQDIVKEYQLLE